MPDEAKRQDRLIFTRPLPAKRPFQFGLMIFPVLLYAIYLLTVYLFHIDYPDWLEDVLLLLVSFSLGVSGLIIVWQGKYVDKSGQIRRGWYAYAFGIGYMLFGFGAASVYLRDLLSR